MGLSPRDVRAIREAVPHVALVAPKAQVDAYKVIGDGYKAAGQGLGGHPPPSRGRPGWRWRRGGSSTSATRQRHAQVAVIGAGVRRDLFVTGEAVGQTVKKLADSEQPCARPRLVPILRLEVVEHLREIAVRADLTRVERDRLLVRHREHEALVVPVGELEDLRVLVTAGRLPELGRRQHRHQHLLGADGVHLLADDLDDLLVDAPAERQERPHAGAHLADVGAADEQLVTDRFRIGRILPERREEELGRARHQSTGIKDASAMASAAGLAIFSRFGRGMPSAIHRSISWKSSSTRMSEETFFSTRPCA